MRTADPAPGRAARRAPAPLGSMICAGVAENTRGPHGARAGAAQPSRSRTFKAAHCGAGRRRVSGPGTLHGSGRAEIKTRRFNRDPHAAIAKNGAGDAPGTGARLRRKKKKKKKKKKITCGGFYRKDSRSCWRRRTCRNRRLCLH